MPRSARPDVSSDTSLTAKSKYLLVYPVAFASLLQPSLQHLHTHLSPLSPRSLT